MANLGYNSLNFILLPELITDLINHFLKCSENDPVVNTQMWGGGVSFEFRLLFLLILKCVCREEGPADTEGRWREERPRGPQGRSQAPAGPMRTPHFAPFPLFSLSLLRLFPLYLSLFLFSPLSPHLKEIEEWNQMATPSFSRNMITT